VVSELKRVGVELTVTDVFKNPTIEALAKRIPNKPSPEDSAVVIREAGTERALFLVHEFTGSLIYAHALMRFIGYEIPVYGIPPARLVNAETSVPTLASRMVGIIRNAQRVGPYRVAGWSFGGVFAYEIARQMLHDGEQIEFLGLFDTYCPDPANVPPRAENANLFLIDMLQSASSVEKFQQFEELRPVALGMKLETLVQICKERSLLPLRLAELPAEHIQRTIDHMRFLFRVYDRYAARPISIPVHLFCNQEVVADPTSLGWTAVLPETLIHKIAVPGTHLTMMEAGNIEALGRALTSALKEGRQSTDTEWLSVSRASGAV